MLFLYFLIAFSNINAVENLWGTLVRNIYTKENCYANKYKTKSNPGKDVPSYAELD